MVKEGHNRVITPGLSAGSKDEMTIGSIGRARVGQVWGRLCARRGW